MNHLDLFSGIGGVSIGFEAAGLNTVAFCEIEEFPRKVLAKHWPEIPIYRDVREPTYERLRSDGIPRPSVISAGFPCQPYSRGNWRRKGREDDRDCASEYVRLVDECKPTFAIGENTEGFIDIGLEAFSRDLEEIGYFSTSLSVPACSVGLPTLERHVWIISTTSGDRLERCIEKAIQNIHSLQGEFSGSDTRIPRRWDSPEARVHRMDEGISRRMDRDRVKALGNAVDPIVPECIARAIREVIEE